jgi:hypothetical protein
MHTINQVFHAYDHAYVIKVSGPVTRCLDSDGIERVYCPVKAEKLVSDVLNSDKYSR